MYVLCMCYVCCEYIDLILMPNGTKMIPIEIEEMIKSNLPFLSNVMLIGDNREYLTCLLTLKVKTCLTSKRLIVLFLYVVCCGSSYWASHRQPPTTSDRDV